MPARGHAGQRVVVDLLAQHQQLAGLRLEELAHTLHHRVHRPRQPLQLGHARLGDLAVAAGQHALGLGDRGVQRPADAPQARPRQDGGHDADDQQPGQQPARSS
jgi:hypothetical protein